MCPLVGSFRGLICYVRGCACARRTRAWGGGGLSLLSPKRFCICKSDAEWDGITEQGYIRRMRESVSVEPGWIAALAQALTHSNPR